MSQTLENLSDKNLVEQYRASKNMQAIAVLYKRYAHLVLGLGLKILGDKSKAQDGVSDIFEIVIEKLQTHQVLNFKAWLYTIAKNHFFKVSKEQSKQQIEFFEGKNEKNGLNFMENSLQNHLYNEEVELLEQKDQLIREAIANLGEAQQVCLKLFFYEKMSYNQIAEQTNYDIKQVKSHIQNGKRKLKIVLEDKLNDHGQ